VTLKHILVEISALRFKTNAKIRKIVRSNFKSCTKGMQEEGLCTKYVPKTMSENFRKNYFDKNALDTSNAISMAISELELIEPKDKRKYHHLERAEHYAGFGGCCLGEDDERIIDKKVFDM